MDASTVAQSLNSLDSLEDEKQLLQLQTLVEGLVPSTFAPELYRALFGVFERFPEHDGYGIFWSIVHLLEKCSRYEPYLIESIRRRPTEFNVRMLGGLINARFVSIAEVDLLSVLTQVAEDSKAPSSARASAQGFLQYHRSHGGSA
jgi:hypothetical protein